MKIEDAKIKDGSVLLKISIDKAFAKTLWDMDYMDTMVLKSHIEKSPRYDEYTGEEIRDDKGNIELFDEEVVDSSIDVIHTKKIDRLGKSLPRVKNKEWMKGWKVKKK